MSWGLANLQHAMREPGCPICRLQREAEKRYLDNLLWENVNDPATREQWAAGLGFCARHAWQLQRLEAQRYGDGLGNALLYEDLLQRVILALEALAQEAVGDPPLLHQRLARSFKRSFLPHANASDPLPGLQGRQRCRVCRLGEDTAQAYGEWLIEGLGEADVRASYEASDGLCLPHLRMALGRARVRAPEVFGWLAGDAARRLQRLLGDLREYIRKHDWNYRDETMRPEERQAWIRAVAFFTGEVENDDSVDDRSG
ncbi:DUF6062 family protein [Thermoflexus sp.]|uniref:DUF6062 family protein n=1 Tax=Thermoflexus sp. TaxID=1969742 RepID=UPI0025D88638|nr:DUF6062 family protein [Thermoflexus sp.]MCS7350902.1 DUF6062 family protein [Thermoflexus sp.]MDW8180353.1 DUF6062 family protein [Anaerolineae bacterium]